ncbi:MAG: hypothetical protein J6B41_02915 [Alistipes sp.]|nr:hypothetical protein [Alistipes sp.]
MKKILLMAVAAIGLLATSCSKDEVAQPVVEKSTVTFTVEAPMMATRALGDGTTAVDLSWAVYAADGTYLEALSGSKAGAFSSLKANVEIELVNGKEYAVIFWAQAPDAPYTFKKADKKVTVADALTSNKEAYDAFYKYETIAEVSGPRTQTIVLTRPFAQLNIATADTAKAADGGLVVAQTKVVVPAYKTLNLVDGSVADEAERTYAMADILTGETIAVGGKTYDLLSMNYLLVNAKELETVKFTVKNGTFEEEFTYNNVPLQRNYKTNIIGNLLTSTYDFTIEIDPIFAEPNYEGYYVEDGKVVVVSAEGLQAVAEAMANDDATDGFDMDMDIVLDGDIDLSALTRAATSNWTPIGTSEKPFTGSLDGKGFSIKNLNIVETEAKEGKAYIGFFGYAKDVTIKNVVFENVNLNVPCLDIDHSQGHIGAVAGSLEGTSTIENVTVKGDIKVYATQDANGASRVAVVAGGNSYGNVTMKNVHVIANEGSYLIANNNTGALAGQLQGKNVFENCSSNIDVTVNKFFAGGIIGLAAGDSKFVNCHTTGDIAVVAGREGRAHDQYRVGGIAGGWADNVKTPCVLENCSYTGKISGKNSDGSVANPLDYAGYVGRGYTLAGCQGSTVIIDGVKYVQKYNTAAEAGIYTVDGVLVNYVSTLAELQEKLNSEESINIVFLENIAGEVMLAQKDDINVTIDGNGKKYDGQIKIHGNSGYRSGTTTIKNVNFETATPKVNFVYATDFGNALRYSSNITVKDCTFTATATATEDVVGVQVKSSKNLVISNCTANGLHSLLQAQSCDANILVEKVTVEGGKNGISLGNTANPTIKNSTIVAREYGVRADGNASRGNLNIENTTITAKQPIIVRKVTTDGYAVSLGNGVELNTEELYDVIFTKGSDDVAYVDPEVAFAYSSVKNFNVFPVEEGAVLNASSAAQLDGLLNGESAEVVLTGDVTASASETEANSGYGATGFKVAAGDVLNGNGNTITVNGANGTWDCAVAATGGTIKNVTVKGAMRGIFMPGADGDLHIDNVIFEDVIYTFNSDAGNKKYGVYISNSTINGWTSHSDVHKEVVYTNCSFGKGSGYAFARPYGATSYVNCDFAEGFKVDAVGKIKFDNCRLNGVALTADNIATLVTSKVENVVEVK